MFNVEADPINPAKVGKTAVSNGPSMFQGRVPAEISFYVFFYSKHTWYCMCYWFVFRPSLLHFIWSLGYVYILLVSDLQVAHVCLRCLCSLF